MGRARITIEVSPSRLELIASGGAVRRVLRSEKSDWGQPWPAALTGLGPTLRQWVTELGLAGAAADVCYGAGTGVAGVFSCPAGAGVAGAEASALLALQEMASFPVAQSPNDCRVVRTDGRGVEKRLHTLATADSAEHVEAIAGLVAGAGLETVSLRPGDACALAQTLLAAATGPEETTRLVVYMWDHGTVLACTGAGRLRFVRTVGIGVEALVDGLCRPLRGRASPESFTLARCAARECLEQHGIPAPDAVLDATTGLTGAGVLPVLQPALQRLGVEIKQSLRFGVDEAARGTVSLEMHGPGARVPGLGAALGAQCGLTVSPTGDTPHESLAQALAEGGGGVMLLPASSAAKRTTGRLRSAVRAGVGAAALVVAGLGVYGHMRLREVEGSLHAAEAQAAGWREARGAAQAVAAARAASAGLLQRVREALGAGAPWRAVMRLVSEASPGVIRLTSVDLRLENGAATALLVGSVRAGDDAAFAELLKGYADALAACPIVQGVKMGATSRVDVNGVTAHRFELTVSLVSLPNDGGLASAGARP